MGNEERTQRDRVMPRHYAAFISYRHLSPDMDIAPILQKMLEHNHVRPNRQCPRKIYPVFLDTSELPTLENLDEGICQALEQSDCLIVICSPNLPLSKYCLREIEYFKQLHGGRLSRIYTLLVGGTAQESFPESLRYEVRTVQNERGEMVRKNVDYEPLFANIVAPSLRESIRKLKKTEYLRLAAAYYRCSFDDLYKRRRRWRIKVICFVCAVVAMLVFGFLSYAHLRNRQYNAAKAETYAAYTESCLREGDELLGLTLGLEGWDAGQMTQSNRLSKALRSAVVQLDYRKRGVPVAESGLICTMSTDIQNCYLGEGDAQAITFADNIVQISDLKTGKACRLFPTDTISISPRDLSRYITIQATVGEDGRMYDTLSIWSTRDNALISSVPFRQSTRDNPRYKIVGVIGNDDVTAITDHNEIIARISRDGELLTLEDVVISLLKNTEAPARTVEPFSVTNGNRMRRQPPAVIDAEGEVVLELNAPNLMTVFSTDWRFFGCLEDDMLTLYETDRWQTCGSVPVPQENLRSLYLLNGTHYILTLHSAVDHYTTTVLDWKTRQVLLEREGYPLVSDAGDAFYCMDGRTLIRYDFHDLDTENVTEVAAQCGDLCLAMADDRASLLDARKGGIVLSLEPEHPEDLCWAADLSRLLLRSDGDLKCYDSGGKLLWSAPARSASIALSEDGGVAAWLDDEYRIRALNANDGTLLYDVDAGAVARSLSMPTLATSAVGTCVVNGEGATWIPADGSAAVTLGDYDSGRLYQDGLLALQNSWSYVSDFEFWDTSAETGFWHPVDNTGLYAYSPVSGYLVRQVEVSGNHPTGELEVLRASGRSFSHWGVIALQGLDITNCTLDSTGEYLSVTVDGRTLVYRLKDMSPILDVTDCPLRFENGVFWGQTAYAGEVFHISMMDGQALRQAATEPITSEIGLRELTHQEKSFYPFSD